MASTTFVDGTTTIVSTWLNDVDQVVYGTGSTTGYVLTSTGDTSLATFQAPVATLAALTDVTITAAANGDYLRYNGAAWVDVPASQLVTDINATLDHGTLTGLADNDHTQYLLVANIDDTPVNGETAQPISSNWAYDHENAADPHTGYRLESADHTHQSTGAAGGQLDHGLALTGLTDDDHTQYLLVAGTRGLSAAWDAGSWQIRAETFQSDVTTGTAPLTVASTTVVTNLNADLLDGAQGSAYLLVANIDDVPVNGETAQPISSNWAFDHAAGDHHAQAHDHTSADSSGVLTGDEHDSFSEYAEVAEPTAPAANKMRLYAALESGVIRFNWKTSSGEVHTLGQDLHIVVRNTSGGAMTAGQLVYVTGSTGNVPNVSLADASALATMPALGFLEENTANNAYGLAQTGGIHTPTVTTGMTAGDELYASETAGGITNVKPVAPAFVQHVGQVLTVGVNGEVLCGFRVGNTEPYAVDVRIADAGNDFTATTVEGALDELQADNEAHVAAADPHTGYRLESADHTHQSTGAQGGTLDHGLALTGLTDDDHTQYLLNTGTRTGSILAVGSADFLQIGGGATASALRFMEPSGSGTNYSSFQAQAQAGNITYTLPAADATISGYALKSNAAGALSWGPAGGTEIKKSITQASHGFVAGNVLYLNGTTYTKADADSASTAEVVGIVYSNDTANTFTLLTSGYIDTLSSLTAGTVYFLSGTAGAYTATEPTTVGQISKPLMVADTTTSAWFFNMRGSTVGNATSTMSVDRFSGNGSATTFTLSATPVSENNTWVMISGVYQQKDTYSIVSGTTLTFSTAPPTGTDNIEVVTVGSVSIGTASATDAGATLTLATEQASTSGTTIDFTGIPSGTKQIIIGFNAVSTNGTSSILVQLGDSGGIENTGYVSSAAVVTTSSTANAVTSTAGMLIYSAAAANGSYGQLILTLKNAATWDWVCDGSHWGGATTTSNTAGRKALSAELTQVRITSVSADTFDAGSINIAYK